MSNDAEAAAAGGTKDDEKVTPARLRLDAARAALAATALSTTPHAVQTVQAGDIVHSLDDRGFLVMRSRELFGESAVTLYRGDSITVTQAILDAAQDRFGNPVGIALAADETAQLREWGRVRLGVGPAPADLERWVHGSPEWASAREAARKLAWSIADPAERAEARRTVEARFGAAPTTSTLLNSAPDPSVAAAAEQRRRLDALGARQVTNFAAREAGANR